MDDPGYQTAINDLIEEINTHLIQFQSQNSKDEQKQFAYYYKKNENRPHDKPPANGRTLIDRADTLLIHARNFNGFRLRVRADIHVEYATLTYLADSFQDAPHNPSYVAEAVANFKTLAHVESFLPKPSDSEMELNAQRVANQLFEGFWDALFEKLQSAFPTSAKKFADFRSVAISLHEDSKVSPAAGGEYVLPDNEVMQSRRDKHIDDELDRFVRRNWKFASATLRTSRRSPSKTKDRAANVVLCGILDGAAVYGSDLGQPVELDDGTITVSPPVRFFVFFNGSSTGQLGRLLRRFNTLGELRMAALFDTMELRAASRGVRFLGTKLTNAREPLGKPENENPATPLSAQTVNDANAELANIGRSILGGLVYRVNQSRYYAQSYRDRIKDLRIARIEGWQPYDEFVRRNLFMEFDYVSQIGERYIALARRIERETSLVQLGEFVKYYNTIQENTATLEEIQLKGNLIADWVGGAAFTYYFGHLTAISLMGLTHPVLGGFAQFVDALFAGPKVDDVPAVLQFFCFAIAFVMFWLARHAIEKQYKRKKARKAVTAVDPARKD